MKTAFVIGCVVLAVVVSLSIGWCRPGSFPLKTMWDDAGKQVKGMAMLVPQGGSAEIDRNYAGPALAGGRWRIVVDLPDGALRVDNRKGQKIITIRESDRTNKILATTTVSLPKGGRIFAYYKQPSH